MRLNLSKTILFFAICICFNTIAVKAQGTTSNNSISGQNGSGLSKIDVDQLSDAEVANLQAQLLSGGVTMAQAEQQAISRGMPQSQWDKLKARFSTTAGAQKNSGANTTVLNADRQTRMDTVKVSVKPSTSDVFGSAFFSTESLSFEPNLRIATPVNYVLGPDDELLINVSGYQELTLKASVQPEGTIFIPQVGSVFVNGLTIEAATEQIRQKLISSAYPSLKPGLSKLTITLGKIRSIHITIVGGSRPGNYTISSLATVYNSLYLCGGPGDINTYRNIELIRNNKVYRIIDLYRFLTSGDVSDNVSLKDNDVINFPVFKKHVSISGEVKRPGVFELKDGESFQKLLFFAGGYTGKAYRANIQVKKLTDTARIIKDLSAEQSLTYIPSNDDEFQVEAILSRVENAVSIAGAVYKPGEFELTPGMTISTLIKRAGGLQESVFKDRATLTRRYPNGLRENITFNVSDVMNGGPSDIKLAKRDTINIGVITNFRTTYKVSIGGEVRKSGDFPYSENLTLKDVIFYAGGFTDAASTYNIEVGRRLVSDRKEIDVDSIAKVYSINTDRNLVMGNDNFILKPFDIITVRRNPGYNEQQKVTIIGEVNYPGSYVIKSKKERVSDLLKRAGGLTPLAYEKGLYLNRNTITDNNAKQKQETVKNVQKSIQDSSKDVNADIAKTNFRIPIDLKKINDDPRSIENYVLLNRDTIEVLKLDPLVKVSGEVFTSTKTSFVEGETLNYYLSQAGGISGNARKSKIYVLYANGHISRTHNGLIGLFRSYPKIESGAEIIVPRKTTTTPLTATEFVGITSGFVSLVTLLIVTITSVRR
ncbi:MAG: capsule biosynthesis protein [Mucilaginibacter sp.]|nr:capsule biosynthesis protein [Mucilaginibacter sp.]